MACRGAFQMHIRCKSSLSSLLCKKFKAINSECHFEGTPDTELRGIPGF